jgi:hypothetical protein
MKSHIPKVDTGDDVDFMCGTHAFGAMVSARDLCERCVNRTLEIVDLLSQAHDELRAIEEDGSMTSDDLSRLAKLVKRIDKVLGKRARVDLTGRSTP